MYTRHKKSKSIVDTILYPLAVFSPLFTLPQVYKVWIEQNIEGVSALSWFLMGCMAMLWFFHAVQHKDRLLMTNTGLMIFFNFSIFLGVFLFSR